MREIKFRGRDEQGRWHFGMLRQWRDQSFAIETTQGLAVDFVDPATVGQFTGLYDCGGHEIYEGDVLGNKYPSHYKFANAVVEWGVDGWLADCFSLREFLKLHICIVVGNIYDNSELLPELPEEDDARD